MPSRTASFRISSASFLENTASAFTFSNFKSPDTKPSYVLYEVRLKPSASFDTKAKAKPEPCLPNTRK